MAPEAVNIERIPVRVLALIADEARLDPGELAGRVAIAAVENAALGVEDDRVLKPPRLNALGKLAAALPAS